MIKKELLHTRVIRMKHSQWQALEEIANKSEGNVSVSYVIRHILDDYLKKKRY